MDYLKIFETANKRFASDIIISVGVPPILRINGELIPLDDFPVLDSEMTYNIVMEFLSEKQKQRLKEELELDFSTFKNGLGRYRVNAYTQRNSLSAAFRTIHEDPPDLKTVGLLEIAKN